jgi:transcriptional regulator with XRE-family HTH domain
MQGRLTPKQVYLATIVRIYRDQLLQRKGQNRKDAIYSGPRLAQYISGARIPDYATAQHIAKVCGKSVKHLPYRRLYL